MIEIRNLLFQPLTFQLAGEERGLYLNARQRRHIEDAQVSDEIRVAAKRGFVALTVLDEPSQPDAQPANSSDIAVPPIEEAAVDESAQVPEESATVDPGAEPETAQKLVSTTDETPSKKRR